MQDQSTLGEITGISKALEPSRVFCALISLGKDRDFGPCLSGKQDNPYLATLTSSVADSLRLLEGSPPVWVYRYYARTCPTCT